MRHPIFESIAILLIAAGIFATLLFSPLSLLSGAGMVAAGVAILLKHYGRLGADTDQFA